MHLIAGVATHSVLLHTAKRNWQLGNSCLSNYIVNRSGAVSRFRTIFIVIAAYFLIVRIFVYCVHFSQLNCFCNILK